MAVAGFSQLEALKRQVNGSIDGIKKAIELLPFWEELNANWKFELVTPIGYLLSLAHCLGIMDEVKEFLVKYLAYAMPALEIGVKGILLSNLTSCISCSTHPFIPDEMRTLYYKETFHVQPTTLEASKNSENGFTQYTLKKGEFSFEAEPRHGAGLRIPVSSIDYNGLLDHSPFGEWNKRLDYVDYSDMYFGVDSGASPYSLARATDFNAYLWFVKNRGYFKDCVVANDITDIVGDTSMHMLEYINATEVGDKMKMVTQGTGVRYSNSVALSVVYDVEMLPDENNKESVVSFKLLPVSSNSSNVYKPSINWYFNRKEAFTNNLYQRNKERDYSLDKPIFSLYYDNNEFVFKILPKPLIHYPVIIPKGGKEIRIDGTEKTYDKSWNEPLTHIEKILFDAAGQPSTMLKKGRFTVCPRVVDNKIQRLLLNDDGHEYIYKLYKTSYLFESAPDDPTPNDELVLYYNSENAYYELRRYNGTNYDYNIPDSMLSEYLFECYAGLTIYQFNFDYIMGMRLFDAKVVLSKIMDAIFNLKVDLSVSKETRYIDEEVSEIVRKIATQPEIGEDKCFFSFDNKEIDRMTEDAINKRKGEYSFYGSGGISTDDLESINNALSKVRKGGNKIDDYNNIKGALDEAERVASNQLTYNTKATKAGNAEASYGVSANLIEKITTELLIQIVKNALLTPKVVMLLQVNKALMGQDPGKLDVDFEALLKSMIGLIYSMAKEIVTLFIQELFELIMAKLGSLLALFAAGMVAEYLAFFAELIREIIEQCGFKIGRNNNGQIDKVFYADIDERNDAPSTETC